MPEPASNPRPCRACGREILFATNRKSGKVLPLERVRTVYVLDQDGVAQPMAWPDGAVDTYVSHFETCPNASRFSKQAQR